jgi:cellulose synthase/poly-beta-1,6-N-acetylglucosamine synthase-like glycosyltransferase
MNPFVWQLLFWCGALFIVYAYVGYPLCLLAMRALRRPERTTREESDAGDADLPRVSIILTVRNEEANVGRKLDNLLALDFPADRMEIWVASDASADRTNEIVRGYRDPRVRLVEYAESQGKAVAVNRTVPLVTAPIVVHMDVRQTVDRQALRRLVAQFRDPEVAVVGGEMVIVDADGRPTSEGTGLYWKFERWLRGVESELELLTGVSGCFYAIRKEVFRPVPPGSYCEDVTLCLYARAAGRKVRWARDAHVFEQLRDPRTEFSRKVRTLVGNYQLLTQFWPLYLPWRGRLAFTLISHKLCRLFVPLALLGVLAGTAALAPASDFHLAALAGQAALYGLGLASIVSSPLRQRVRLANACGTFCMLNWAALLALVHVLRHGPRIGWR